jgi:hypothetical protein
MPNRTVNKNDIYGIVFPNGKLEEPAKQEFRKVSQHSIALARRYANHWGRENGTWNEVHWGYRERAHVGFFATAVWMAGGVALEEYVSEKKRPDGTRYTGRSDLCFALPSGDYVAEAKHTRAELPIQLQAEREPKPVFKPILDELMSACRDASALSGQGVPLGFVFVTLQFCSPVTDEPDEQAVTAAVKTWVKAVQNHPKLKRCLLTSWFFPVEGRKLVVESKGSGRRYGNPGTAIFVAHAKAFA